MTYGFRFYASIYHPVGEGRFAAMVFVPGGLSAGVLDPALPEARNLGIAEYGWSRPTSGWSALRADT